MEKEPSETQQLMKEFWTGLREYMNDNGSSVNCPAPTTRNYLQFSIGRTNFFIRAWLVSSTKEIRLWLYMRGNNAEAHFRLLEELRCDLVGRDRAKAARIVFPTAYVEL